MKRTYYTDRSGTEVVVASSSDDEAGMRELTIGGSVAAQDCREIAVRLLQLADRLEAEATKF